jgi:hypothetical protein
MSSLLASRTTLTQLRVLLGLRFRLLIRQLVTRRMRLVSTIVLAVILTPMSVGLGLGAAWGTRYLLGHAAPAAVHEWIHLVHFGVFALLIVTPVLGFRGSEFYDLTKLFSYPVPSSTVFVSMILGMLASGTVLFFLPALVLPILVLPGGPGLVVLRLAGTFLLLFLAVATGQLLVYLLLNVLRSRRFRDLAAMIGPLFGAAIYLMSRLVAVRGRGWLDDLVHQRPSRWLVLSPSTWITRATGAPEGPDAYDLVPMLLGALPLTLLVVAVSSWLQDRAFLGEIRISVPQAAVRNRRRTSRGGLLRRLLPADVRAIARKEWTALRREPMVKTLLIHQSAFFLIPIVFAVLGVGGALTGASAVWYVRFLPLLLLFVEGTLILNNLGLEGRGLVHLLTTPVSRARILAGKNVVHLALFGPVNVVLVVGLALGISALVPGASEEGVIGASLQSGAAALVTLVAFVALGNLVSVLAPTVLTVRGRRALQQQQSGREGCGVALVRLASILVVFVLLSPILLLLHLPDFVSGLGEWFLFVSWPLSAAYAVGLLIGSIRLGARLLQRREPRLVARFSRSED